MSQTIYYGFVGNRILGISAINPYKINVFPAENVSPEILDSALDYSFS